MAKTSKLAKWIYLTLIIFTSFACNVGGSNTSGTGTLSLGLTDASTDDYKAVYVTIKEVRVHAGEDTEGEDGGLWEVAAEPDATYNLLELVNGVIEQLGIRDIEAGHYTQLRLIIDDTADGGTNINGEPHPFANYIIDQSDTYRELKIPSGYQTGIKIVHGFDIAEGQITELILDFDASTSIVKAGNSGIWILKPAIKVIDRVVSASISGFVFDIDENSIEGVTVSAQLYDSNSEDLENRLVSHSRAVSEADGYYFMYLWPGAHKMVLLKDGYGIACKNIEVESGASYNQNFTLETTEAGTISGVVTFGDALDSQSAVLSFRTGFMCNGSIEEPIEVISKSIADGGTYSVNLPPGRYHLVASSEGKTTQEYNDIEVTASHVIVQNVAF